MKKIGLIMVGFLFLIFGIICPLPAILGVSGIVWRIVLGLLGCFLLGLGIYKAVRKRQV